MFALKLLVDISWAVALITETHGCITAAAEDTAGHVCPRFLTSASKNAHVRFGY